MRLVSSISLLSCILLANAAPAPAQTRVAAKGADSKAPGRSTVLHIPPSEAAAEDELRLVAVVDAAWVEASLVVKYRPRGSSGAFAESPFERSSAGGYFASLPASAMRRPGVEYYIAGQLPDGTEVLHFASPDAPHAIAVAPSLQVRWAEKERQRLGGHVSEVSLDVRGHNFGNRFQNTDQFLRGELEWTHRLLTRWLYSISLGYGFIEGRTPGDTTSDAVVEPRGARYGYAGVRLRLHRSLWADAQASMGFSRDGFIVGGGGALTLGRPWRSNISFGAEYLVDMGPSAWFRLQWDTVPPFLMGATVYKTDLPGAALANGSFVIYDISYPVSPRFQVRGSLSFGSRDGPGHFGGGLGTTFAF